MCAHSTQFHHIFHLSSLALSKKKKKEKTLQQKNFRKSSHSDKQPMPPSARPLGSTVSDSIRVAYTSPPSPYPRSSLSHALRSKVLWFLTCPTSIFSLYLSSRMRWGSGTKPIRTDRFSRMGCYLLGGGGKRKHQVTFRRVGFRWTTCVFEHPHFLCYILHIDQWGFPCSMR